jgi:hypothetical protein
MYFTISSNTALADREWVVFDPVRQSIDPWIRAPQMYQNTPGLSSGNTAFKITYKDGATRIDYIAYMPGGSTAVIRAMII